MLKLFALLKPDKRTDTCQVVFLDSVGELAVSVLQKKILDAKCLDNMEFIIENTRGESIIFRGSDVVYITFKEQAEARYD